MADELKQTLVQHCAANPRILMQQAAELLDHAMKKNLSILDEKLFFDTFGALTRAPNARKKTDKTKGTTK